MIRPDLMYIWLETVLSALKKARDDGKKVRVRFLLATLTFPEEAKRFIGAMEEVILKMWPSLDECPVEGCATMLETTGAYVLLEDILSAKGRRREMIGGLIGSNDFTAACLNMNRADAPRYMLPGYVKSGILSSSPYDHIEKMVVGKAMCSALKRSSELARSQGRALSWGLAGELAADWDSVQWFARNLAKVGLDYITTTPDAVVKTLLAAASSQFLDERTGDEGC